MQLLLQPEEKEINRYINFCIRNGFSLEVDYQLLNKKTNCLSTVEIVTVHGSNYFNNENKIIEEIKLISVYHPKFIIYHDEVLEQLDKETLKKINFYLLKNKIKLLIENIKYNKYNEFRKCFLNIKKNISNIGQCVDFGHIYLGGGNIDEWTKEKYDVAHIHNNYGVNDSHLSLYDGLLDYHKLTINLKSASYISLEVNCGYNSYIKNILFLIKNKIGPFEFPENYLNLPFYRSVVKKKVLNSFRLYKNNIVYCFFYGSFSSKKCHNYSDLDCFICSKNRFNHKKLINTHKQNCRELGFIVDNSYPIEIFNYKYVSKMLEKKIKKFSADQIEIIKAHLMKTEFIAGDKKEYLKIKNIFYGYYKQSAKNNLNQF